MAAPVVVTADAGAVTSTRTAVPAPSNVVAGDLVLIFFGFSGFSAGQSVTSSGFTAVVGPFDTSRAVWLWKRSTGSEPSTYSVSAGSAGSPVLQAYRVTGAVTSGDPIRTSANAVDGDGSTTTPAVTLTGLVANDLIVYGDWLGGDTATFTVPTGFTQEDPGGAEPLGVASKAVTSGGSSGAITGTTSLVVAHSVNAIAIVPPLSDALAVTFPKLTVANTVSVTVPTTIAVTFPKLTAAMTTAQTTAVAATTFPSFTVSIQATALAQITTTFPSFGASSTGTVTVPTTIAVTFPKLTTALAGGNASSATIAVTFPKLSPSLTVIVPVSVVPVVVDADTSTTGTGLTVNAPTNVAAGDLVLIFFGYFRAGAGTVTSSGFTVLDGGGGNDHAVWLWKRSTGSEPSTYTITAAGTSGRFWQSYRVTGAVASGDPIRTSGSASGTSTATPSVTLTGLVVDDLILYGDYLETSRSFTIPAGFARVTASASQTGHVASKGVTSAGSSGVISGTLSGSSSQGAQAIAIMPVKNPAVVATTFPKFSASLTVAQTTSDTDVTFPTFATSSTAVVGADYLLVTFPAFTAALTVVQPTASLGATFPSFATALTVALSVPTTLAVTFPKLTPHLSGGVQSIVHHAVTFPKFHVALDVTTTTAPTWQEVVRSAEYLAAAAATTRNVSARVEMVDDNELVVAAIPITGGNVSCDSTVDERWAATITLGESDYMPSEVTDLLHPLSGLRARIWWTLELPSGLLAEVPIGTYYSSTPAATNNGTFGLTVKLLDVTSRIRRNKWGTGDVTDLGGMTVSAALRAVFTNRAPRFTAQITDTTETLPAIYEVGQVGRDPLSDILSIADAGAYTVYSDRMGGLVAEPRGNTDNTRTVLDLSVGPDCRMESIQRSLDETQLLNVVTVQSTSSEVDPPVFATVEDNDPASPLWVGNGFIYSDVISSDSVTTEAQCRTLATVTLAERRALIESVDCVHRSRPEIDPLNLLTVNEPKTGASGVYQLASWSIDLEPGSMQRSVLSDRRVAV